MAIEPIRVACIGMGWWSDVLADAIKRSGKLIEIAACYTRSTDKRDGVCRTNTTAGRRRPTRSCWPTARIEAIINTTPNNVHLETTRAAAAAGKHVFLDKPIANTDVGRARASPRRAARQVSCSHWAISAAGEPLPLG